MLPFFLNQAETLFSFSLKKGIFVDNIRYHTPKQNLRRFRFTVIAKQRDSRVDSNACYYKMLYLES